MFKKKEKKIPFVNPLEKLYWEIRRNAVTDYLFILSGDIRTLEFQTALLSALDEFFEIEKSKIIESKKGK